MTKVQAKIDTKTPVDVAVLIPCSVNNVNRWLFLSSFGIKEWEALHLLGRNGFLLQFVFNLHSLGSSFCLFRFRNYICLIYSNTDVEDMDTICSSRTILTIIKSSLNHLFLGCFFYKNYCQACKSMERNTVPTNGVNNATTILKTTIYSYIQTDFICRADLIVLP